mgnify:CR=1 FL=1
MQVKVSQISGMLLDFVEKSPPNILETDSIVLSNARWNLHLDYVGDNPERAMDSIKILANHKKDILKKFAASESPSQILNTARDFADYFNYREFNVMVSSKNNFFWQLVLRGYIFLGRFF